MTKMNRVYFVLIIIILLILWSLWASDSKPHHHALAEVSMAPVVDELTAYGIDLPAGETITPEDIENGKYPIEAVNIGNNNFVIDTAHRFGRFWRFDSNGDGLIDQRDPFYAQAAMGIIDPETKTIRFVSWQEAGIRALILDPTHLTPEKGGNSLPVGFWAVHSTIVTADGFKWLTFHVPVPTNFVDSLRTSVSNQHLVKTLR